MENKNILIAFVLMLAVWVGVNFLFPKPEAPPEQQAVVESLSTGLDQTSSATTGPAVTPVLAEQAIAVPQQERELVVKTGRYEAVFSSVGGRLKSLQLPAYSQTTAINSPPVSLVEAKAPQFATLRTEGIGEFDISEEGLYALSVDEEQINLEAGEERQIVFSAISPRGLKVEKIYRLRGDSFDFDLQVRVTNLGSQAVRGATSLTLVQPWDESMEGNRYSFVGPAVYDGEKVHTHKVKDIVEDAPVYGEGSVWTSFERKYFMSAVVALADAGEKFRIEKNGDLVENSIETPYAILTAGQSISADYLCFFGPRDLDILEASGHQLDKAIDFGFFGIIARPLLTVLNLFYSYVGNWGVAIILLTCIIKLLFWPLTQKSYKSMKSMQTLQPEMQKLREKFKDNKEQLNKEIMALYKTKRVNPMGGCLPMVVQIPVFFALYKVLLGTIALRHAPFAFWLQDLSVKDPYYITPIIMGVTMFFQQKMSPSTMDPAQAKIFMFMPLIFTFMFLNFPSGLVLYWLVNNLLTILQQWHVNREPKVVAS
jgi:YidC/Oxa1 family membrane protein insertase